MNKTISAMVTVITIGLACVIGNGCGDYKNFHKRTYSAPTALTWHVTLYSASGSVIKEWDTQARVFDNGGVASFLNANDNDKRVRISGTFIIEER